MKDPDDGILGIGVQWGAPEQTASPPNAPITDSAVEAIARDLPGCLLVAEMSLRLDGIKGQTAEIDQRAHAMRTSLGLGSAEIDDLHARIRDVSDNTLKQHPAYYRAIILELKSRAGDIIHVPVPGIKSTISILLSEE